VKKPLYRIMAWRRSPVVASPGRWPGPRRAPLVVIDHLRVVDGQVGRALLEVLGRIASIVHHLLDELVGVADRSHRVVHELHLGSGPKSFEA
jgi:hypothetical protein